MMTRKRAHEQTLQEAVVSGIANNRRNKKRYAISLEVEYKVVKDYLILSSGSGTSVDLSSSGIAFRTGTPLKVGSCIELSACWPVLLDGSCPLKLVVFGRVVRNENGITAVAIDRYEFRTRKVGSMQPAVAPLAVAACFR